MHDSFGQPNAEPSTFQLILDQLEELVATVIEEVRERPGIAVAILAAIVGTVVGAALAARATGTRGSRATKVVRKVRGMGEAADLAALGLKLLQNPIVRSYVRSAVESQLKKRF